LPPILPLKVPPSGEWHVLSLKIVCFIVLYCAFR
jgi:hypothetical protein